MIDIKAIRAAAEAAKGLPEGEWIYEPTGQSVWSGEIYMVCDIRGWGHLQYLPNGSELQDSVGRHIANMSPLKVIALCDEIEQLRKDAGRCQWLTAYLAGASTQYDDLIIEASKTSVEEVNAVIDAAMQSGEKHGIG